MKVRKVKVVGFDWDGTLLNSFRGHPIIRTAKEVFFKRLRRFYIFGELAEVCAGVSSHMHLDARYTIDAMRLKGVAIGIITDRSLFSFIISSQRARFNLKNLDFIYARKSKLNKLVKQKIPQGVFVITTPYLKGDPRALKDFIALYDALKVNPTEILFVGDDERDRVAAKQCGFRFIQVDRTRPNFKLVRDEICK